MIKYLLTFLILSSVSLAQIFVAPDGDDNNPGTIDLPLKTLTKAVSLSGPDTTIFMRGGIYYDSTTIRLNKSGTEGHYIKIWAYQQEVPIIDFSGQPVSTSSRGIYISHNYWYLRGLVIINAKDNGIYITSWYNIVENCVLFNNNDTGLQISNGGAYNNVINCDSYENHDPLTNGENADGFAAKLGIGPGNIFRSCRAWNNSDDGYDMWEATDTVLIDKCWSFRNGYNIWGIPNYAGDGNGFKLGGNYYADPHKIIRSVAFDNVSKGFDQNNNTAGITVYNNTAWGNGSRNFSFPTAPTSGMHILKNNISYEGQNLITSGSIQEANSWQGFVVGDTDFRSLDSTLAVVPRDTNGELPETDFLRLAAGSSLIDAGVYVGLPYNGSAPDLGAFEYSDNIPVEFTLFTSSIKGQTVLLEWSTSTETNNSGFELQRKNGENNFIKIGFIKGNGTTTEQHTYRYTDKNPDQGLNSYRLKQYDFDGSYEYSDVVNVNFTSPTKYSLEQNFPNPFNPATNFSYSIPSAGMVNLEMYNMIGEKVDVLVNTFQEAGSYKYYWNANLRSSRTFSSGIYLVRLKWNEYVKTIKIMLLK